MKPGVLILTPFYEPNVGGVETHLKDLTDYLKKTDRYRVYVLTYQPLTTKAKGAYSEGGKDDNVKIIRIPWIGFNLFHKLEPYPMNSNVKLPQLNSYHNPPNTTTRKH